MYSYMIEEIIITIHKQMVQIINIYQTHMKVRYKIKSIRTRYWQICILEYVLEYLIDEREYEIDNYNY